MHTSLDQRFSRAGFNGIAGDSDRTVSRKPDSLDYRVTIKNDIYGPPPSALRTKLSSERGNTASGSRPGQIATNNSHLNSGKRFTGDFQPQSGPSNRRRGQPTDWHGRSHGEDQSNRGRARIGPFAASNSRGGGSIFDAPPSATSDAFRGRHVPPLKPLFPTAAASGAHNPELNSGSRSARPSGHYGVGRGQHGFGSSTPRRGVGGGTTGRLVNMHHTHLNAGSTWYEQQLAQTPGRSTRGVDRSQYSNSGAYIDPSWGSANRNPRYNRPGKSDWFGRPKPPRGGGAGAAGTSGVWMHDDRFSSKYKQPPSATGNRFNKRPMLDRKLDLQGFMGSSAIDEYIDDFTPEDLAKYKLEINMDPNQRSFTVKSPLLSDPILRTPLSKWGSNELYYSPERDLFALHTPDLDFDLEDGTWTSLQQPSRKTRRSPQVRTPLMQHPRRNGYQPNRHANVLPSGAAQPEKRDKPIAPNTVTNAVTEIETNVASDQTSQSTDKTSTSINTSSSIHQAAEDSGLGESVKRLSSTKSCEDLISDGSSSLLSSIRDSDLYRCGSCPDSMHASRNSHGDFYPSTVDVVADGDDDCVNDDEREGAMQDQLQCHVIDDPGLNRAHSCCLVPLDKFPVSTSGLRRTRSIPNWFPGIGFQIDEPIGVFVQPADSDDGEPT